MNRVAISFAILLCLIITDQVSAEDRLTLTRSYGITGNWLDIDRGHIFRVVVDDQIKEGCWTNPDATKIATQLELKRSGYKIGGSSDTVFTDIVITSVGYETTPGSCAANYDLEVLHWAYVEFNSGGHVAQTGRQISLWRARGLLTGSKSYVNTELKNVYVEAIQKFLIDVDTMRERALEAIRSSAEGDAKVYWDIYKLN